MRENRLYGSEGGGAGYRSPYPYVRLRVAPIRAVKVRLREKFIAR